MKIKRSTALITSLAIVASAVIGFAIGKANTKTTSNFENTASTTGLPVLAKLGFYPGYGSVPYLTALEAWFGRSAQYVVQFGDVRTGSAFMSSVWGEVVNAGALQTISGRVTMVESVPLGFGNFVDAYTAAGQATARATLQATASGANDNAFNVVANYLKNGGYPNAIIRLGWEFDGGWMPWSSRGNEALWVAAYKHVHDLFRAVSPGFRFDWNGSSGYLQTQTAAYPGDGYVDIVGLDVYDKGMGGATAWNSSTKTWKDPAAAWAKVLPNLVAQRTFALAHGKPVSYPEWALNGVSATATTNVGGDDPTFIQGMHDWMSALPGTGAGSLAYQSYFNEDEGDGNHKINSTYFPIASALFKTLFAAADATTPTTQPPVIQPPAVPGVVTSVPATTVPATTVPATTVPPATTEPTFSMTVTCGAVTHKCALTQPAGP